MHKRRQFLHLCGAAAVAHPFAAWAQVRQPNTVRLLVGFPAGATGDRIARAVAPSLEASLRTGVIVDNKAGAGGQVAIEFTKTSGTDPNGLAQQLRALAEKEPLTEDEQILLGRTLASAGKTDDARQVYAALPLRASTEKPALQLLSSILRQEGHGEEARELERRATRQVPEEPASRMKMSLEDAKSMFPEIRRRAHDELLQIAREETRIALEAVTHLTVDPLLTAAEARELLSIVDNHPQQKLPVRLGVISALMRITPDQREALLDEAIKHFRSDDAGSLEHLARWLALEAGVAAIPVSVFYQNKCDDRVIRFCFAKQETTLGAAGARLRRI